MESNSTSLQNVNTQKPTTATLDEANMKKVVRTKLLERCVMKYLNDIDLSTISVSWPWQFKLENGPFIVWLYVMLKVGLLNGFVGLDVNFKSNWEFDLICSAEEQNVEFQWCCRVLYWRYRAWTCVYKENLFPIVIYPTLQPTIRSGQIFDQYDLRPFDYSSNALSKLFQTEIAFNDRVMEDTAMTSQRSSLGVNVLKANASDMPSFNTDAAVKAGLTIDPNYVTSISVARARDIENAVEFDSKMIKQYEVRNSVEVSNNNWLPSFVPTGMEQTIQAPPRSNIFSTISLQKGIVEMVNEQLFTMNPLSKIFVDLCINMLYTNYLSPEKFYDFYLRIYNAIFLEFKTYINPDNNKKEKKESLRTDKIIHFRDDLLSWYNEEYLTSNSDEEEPIIIENEVAEDNESQPKKKKQKVEKTDADSKEEKGNADSKEKKNESEESEPKEKKEKKKKKKATTTEEVVPLDIKTLKFLKTMDDLKYRAVLDCHRLGVRSEEYDVPGIIKLIVEWLTAKTNFCQQEIEKSQKSKKNKKSKLKIKWNPSNVGAPADTERKQRVVKKEDDEENLARDIERRKDFE